MLEISTKVRKTDISLREQYYIENSKLLNNNNNIILSEEAPNYDIPYELKEAAIEAIRDGISYYTDNSGFDELKQVLVKLFKEKHNINININNILITPSYKYSLYIILKTIIDEGNEILVPLPYIDTYIQQINLLDGVPKFIVTSEEEEFKIELESLEKNITSRIKGLIINNPSNPSGILYNENELNDIADLALKKNIYIISDENYDLFTYENNFKSIISISNKYLDNTITIKNLSNMFSIPGWGLSLIIAKEDIIKKLYAIQSNIYGNPNNIIQKAIMEAIKKSENYYVNIINEFSERRNYIFEALNNIHGIRCIKPSGTFFIFPNIKYYLGKDIKGLVPNNSIEFCKIVLEKCNISLVPGSYFGLDGYIRISFNQPIVILKEAIKRINSILQI